METAAKLHHYAPGEADYTNAPRGWQFDSQIKALLKFYIALEYKNWQDVLAVGFSWIVLCQDLNQGLSDCSA